MIRNLDIAALRSFIAIADTGGVTRAAQRLHLTQSAVSMQIKRLEESLGVPLLDRQGRSVALTKRGEEMLSDARRLIAMNDAIWERMTTPECRGEVVFGVPTDIIYPHIPAIMKAFTRDHPSVKVSLVSSMSALLLEQLAEGKMDVILTTELGVQPGGETLLDLPLVWVGAPGGVAWARRPVPIAFERRCAFRPLVIDILEKTGLGWDWAVDTDRFDAAIASVAADLAVNTMLRGTLPTTLVEVEHDGQLPELPSWHINLYVNKGPNADLANRLADYTREAYAAAIAAEERPALLRSA